MKEIDKTIDRENLVFRANEYTYSFKKLQTTNTVGRDIYKGKITSLKMLMKIKVVY